jgi:uncharacterized protein YndB with AHSA1/START domain
MARNEIHIDTTPERVFEVLADPESYGHWVVGSKHIRDADPGFPKLGTRFHHTVGFGPLTVKDHTCVEEVDPPRKLVLRAKARPLGTARVTLHLRPEGAGTKVIFVEDPADRLTAFVFQPLTHLIVRGRNVESLRRLKEMAEDPAVHRAKRG